MDFRSLNRRELQSLCKLNKIPANVTNIAMADALTSLETVVGIEEILNHSRSEVVRSSVESLKEIEISSPRVPRTSCRTSTIKKVKKLETELRKKLSEEANELLKTPLVYGDRKKRNTTATRESNVKRETTVQRVYNTRRSARLTENKCTEAGVTERNISQPVKIASFLEEASVISLKSVGSGFSSVETLHESNISIENTDDDVSERTDEKCDEGFSRAKVEDICIEFDKLDVVTVDGSDHDSVIEKVDCFGKNVDLEDKHKVEVKFILNEFVNSEDKSDLVVENTKHDSQCISKPCEDKDLEENIMVANENVDQNEALSLISDGVLSGEKEDCCGENVEHKVEEKFILNEADTFEETNDQVDNMNSNSEGILNPFENRDFEEKLMVMDENSEKAEYCENVDVKEKHEVKEKFILNETEIFNEKSDQVDIIKSYSVNISSPCENDEIEKNLMVVDEKTDFHDTLNVSGNEHSGYLASEECSNSLICDKVLTEANDSNADSISRDIENLSDYSGSVSDMRNDIDLHQPLNVSLKEHNVYLAPEVEASSAGYFSCNSENPTDLPMSVSEMNNEILGCNGSTNNNVNRIGLLKSENPDTCKETTEEITSTNMVGKNVETSEETHEYLIKDTAVDIEPAIYQQTENPLADVDNKVTRESLIDLIRHPTHLISIYNQAINNNNNNNNNSPKSTKEKSQISDHNKNSAAEDDKISNKKVEDKKLISLNESSLRQLKKQLKVLSIKSNMNTNKDDMVAEGRPVLQSVCDNHLVIGEEN